MTREVMEFHTSQLLSTEELLRFITEL